MELRAASRADVDTCLEVQRRAAIKGYAHIFPQADYPFPAQLVRAEWVERLASDAQVIVAEVAGEAVGTITAAAPHLAALFVLPEHWGTGVAGELHDEALERIAASGAGFAALEVMADNQRARRFYERRGWRPDGRREPALWPPYPILLGYRRELGA